MARISDDFHNPRLPMFIRELFDPEINVQDQDQHGNTILHRFVFKNINYHGLTDRLIQRGTNLELKNNQGRTAFLQAVFQLNGFMIKTFLQYHPDVHTTDAGGHNALHYLVFAGVNVDLPSFQDWVLPLFERLFEERIDINLRNHHGDTPLMWAAKLNNLNIVKVLLMHGADVHIENRSSRTCLHFASIPTSENAGVWSEQKSGIITELIRKGAPINSFDNRGRTPLAYILLSGHANKDYIAREFLIVASLANWRERIDFYIFRARALGMLPTDTAMISVVSACYAEIARMRSCRLSEEGYNLCQFALGGVSTAEQRTADRENYAALLCLLRQTFELYHNLILYSFDVDYLRQKFTELSIYASIEERDIVLNVDTKYEISKSLQIEGLFATLQASEMTAP